MGRLSSVWAETEGGGPVDLAHGGLTLHEYWRPEPAPAPWLETFDAAIRMRTVADRPLGRDLLYSSGTTGTPKGVMFHHRQFFYVLAGAGGAANASNTMDEYTLLT